MLKSRACEKCSQTGKRGTWFGADEIWVKVAGNQKYLFASMDDNTRYWIVSDIADTKFQHNADALLQLTKKNAGGKDPKQFIRRITSISKIIKKSVW